MRSRLPGFSLPELLFTLALIAVLMLLATPQLPALIAEREGQNALKAFVDALNMARTAAIKSGITVTVCRSADGTTCGGEWHEGLIVFSDINANRMPDSHDVLLLAKLFAARQGTLRWRAFGNRQSIQISPTGEIRHQSGNLTFCPHSGDLRQAQQLIVTATGRIRVALDQDGDGIRENARGQALSC